MSGKVVAIISGGIDSCGVASYWKLKKESELHLITYYYGQRAKQEITRALEIGKIMKVAEHKVLDISFMKELYGKSNVLTDETKEMPSKFQSNIIVPVRNAVFLSIGAAYAFSIGAEVLAYGAHLSDATYPDCRPEFAKTFADAINLGDIDAIRSGDHHLLEIWSPATQGLKKEEMLKISYELLGNDLFRTWSCYLDGETQCGKCESCNNRKLAFKLAGIEDHTRYLA